MTDVEELDDEPGDQPRYRDVAEIGRSDLYDALMGLAGFAENPYLAMQARQLPSSAVALRRSANGRFEFLAGSMGPTTSP